MARSRPVSPPPEPRRAIAVIVSAVALLSFITLAVGDLLTSSQTSDETVHLVGGYSYLVTGDYRLNPEHPPLLKMVAALPLLGMPIWPPRFREAGDGSRTLAFFREAWAMSVANPGSEWRLSQILLYGLRDRVLQRVGTDPLNTPTTERYAREDFLNDSEAIFRRARVVMLFLGVLLVVVIFLWSYELWGILGATFSLLLYCFDPNFIAHSALVTTDVGVTLVIFLTAYMFWRYSRQPRLSTLMPFCVSFGLAQTVKFSAVLLVPVVLVLAVWHIVWGSGERSRRVGQMVVALAGAAAFSVLAIWGVYGFRNSTVPDPEAARAEEIAARSTLRQSVLAAPDIFPTGHFDVRRAVDLWAAWSLLSRTAPDSANDADVRRAMRTARVPLPGRFVLFAHDHRLLPETYLYGFAAVAAGAMVRTSYLNGHYSNTGFPDYFLWTFLYKTPLPILVACVAGIVIAFRLRARAEGLGFVVWPALIYASYAATSNLHIGHRHIFPILPFLYALCGAAGLWWTAIRSRRAVIGVIAVVCLGISAVVVFRPSPTSVVNQHFAYLNELAGGPRGGIFKLSDSNFDWGQDLKRLGAWYEASGIREPINLIYFGNADPRFYGIRFYNLHQPEFSEPYTPGWLAISQFDFIGINFHGNHRDYWRRWLEENGAVRVTTPGYSIFVYRIGERPRGPLS